MTEGEREKGVRLDWKGLNLSGPYRSGGRALPITRPISSSSVVCKRLTLEVLSDSLHTVSSFLSFSSSFSTAGKEISQGTSRGEESEEFAWRTVRGVQHHMKRIHWSHPAQACAKKAAHMANGSYTRNTILTLCELGFTHGFYCWRSFLGGLGRIDPNISSSFLPATTAIEQGQHLILFQRK